MKIIIEAEPREIADLVLAVQGRPGELELVLDGKQFSESVCSCAAKDIANAVRGGLKSI